MGQGGAPANARENHGEHIEINVLPSPLTWIISSDPWRLRGRASSSREFERSSLDHGKRKHDLSVSFFSSEFALFAV